MKKLTEKQKIMFDTIEEYIKNTGVAPTITELMQLLDISSNSIHSITQWLEALEKKGYISRGRGYRSIKILSYETKNEEFWEQLMLNIPILGIANAGQALEYAESRPMGTLKVQKNIVKNDPTSHFLVQINGTSMNNFTIKGKKILPNSYALISIKEKDINDNDAYLCIVDWCATVKKIKQEGDTIYLIPSSSDKTHTPIILNKDTPLEINGKVVDIFNI